MNTHTHTLKKAKQEAPKKDAGKTPPVSTFKMTRADSKCEETAAPTKELARTDSTATKDVAVEKLPAPNDNNNPTLPKDSDVTNAKNANTVEPEPNRNAAKAEESNGVGDKIKKFEKAAEDSAIAGRLSRPGSVRGRSRSERLGSDSKEESLTPPPPHACEPDKNLATDVREAFSASAGVNKVLSPSLTGVKWQKSGSDSDARKPEPQKIIKPEFKPLQSPIDATIRSPSLGAKVSEQFSSHGTAFRNVAASAADKPNEDVNTQNNHKACKFKGKEKYSVSKGSSYFTRGSEEIWLVKKKDIEEIEERVLDSFRRAGGNVCMRSEAVRPASDSGQAVAFSHATMGRTKRQMYARSESLDPQWAGARAQTLKRQSSVACTCGHDKKVRAKSAGGAGACEPPRPRSRSHGDDNAQAHVLDKYETLV